jgi:hypothetical protein
MLGIAIVARPRIVGQGVGKAAGSGLVVLRLVGDVNKTTSFWFLFWNVWLNNAATLPDSWQKRTQCGGNRALQRPLTDRDSGIAWCGPGRVRAIGESSLIFSSTLANRHGRLGV